MRLTTRLSITGDDSVPWGSSPVTMCRHGYETAAIPPLEHAHPTIVGQQLGPAFDSSRERDMRIK